MSKDGIKEGDRDGNEEPDGSAPYTLGVMRKKMQ
jgi:hypothetical protein